MDAAVLPTVLIAAFMQKGVGKLHVDVDMPAITPVGIAHQERAPPA